MTQRSAPKPEAAARLLELIQMRLISGAIHVVAALGVADLLADGPRSSDELASATGASVQPLRRVMRALAGFGVFSQDSAGRFELAPLGEFLRSDTAGSMHGAALFFGNDIGPNVIQLFLECVKTGESAVHQLAGDRDLFKWLQSDPERTKLFNSVMNSFSILHITGLMEVYDFSPAKKIVDVGGGHGKIISEVLRKNPSMRGVLFDLPHAFEGGKKAIAQAGLADRCEVISGDFFVSLPAGADTCILSRVIHVAMMPNPRIRILAERQFCAEDSPHEGRLIGRHMAARGREIRDSACTTEVSQAISTRCWRIIINCRFLSAKTKQKKRK